MTEAQPRTIIDPAKLFSHAPAFSTRSRKINPARIELSDSRTVEQENTEEFLSKSFIDENALQSDEPSEQRTSAKPLTSSLRDGADDIQSNSHTRMANEIGDYFSDSVHSGGEDE